MLYRIFLVYNPTRVGLFVFLLSYLSKGNINLLRGTLSFYLEIGFCHVTHGSGKKSRNLPKFGQNGDQKYKIANFCDQFSFWTLSLKSGSFKDFQWPDFDWLQT